MGRNGEEAEMETILTMQSWIGPMFRRVAKENIGRL